TTGPETLANCRILWSEPSFYPKDEYSTPPLSELKQTKSHGSSRPTLKDVELEHILWSLTRHAVGTRRKGGSSDSARDPSTTLIYDLSHARIENSPTTRLAVHSLTFPSDPGKLRAFASFDSPAFQPAVA